MSESLARGKGNNTKIPLVPDHSSGVVVSRIDSMQIGVAV